MGQTHFHFVKHVANRAQKSSDAALLQLSHPAGHGFACWKHAVLLYLREHMDAEYAEVIDWAEEMERVRALLGFDRGDFPHPSTLCKAFKRTPMQVWRQLLRRSSELMNWNGHGAIDATISTASKQASSH